MEILEKGGNMTCPKCEEGIIEKIKFKKDGSIAFLCDSCESLWLENENISVKSIHTLSSFSKDQDIEYTIEKLSEKDQDHEPIKKYED